jgi:cytochrome P450
VVKALHDKYGPIVRLASDELSFTDPQAWQDIYGQGPHEDAFPKNTKVWMRPHADGVDGIFSAGKGDHSRMRRLLAHAFSEKALQAQEPLIQSYIDLKTRKLHQKAESSPNRIASVNICDWLNFTAFDIISDLSFGESFGCLESGVYHPWIPLFFQNFKSLTMGASTRYLLGLENALRWLLPKDVLQERLDHFKQVQTRVQRRLARGEDPQKSDFMTYLLPNNGEKLMTIPEIEATFAVLVCFVSQFLADPPQN